MRRLAPGRGAEIAARWRARQLEASWLRTAMERWVDFDVVTADALGHVLREMGVAAEPAAVARTRAPSGTCPSIRRSAACSTRCAAAGSEPGS